MNAEESNAETIASLKMMSAEALDLMARLVERNSDDLKAVTDAVQSGLERENLELRAELRLIKQRVTFLAHRHYTPNIALFERALEWGGNAIDAEIEAMKRMERRSDGRLA